MCFKKKKAFHLAHLEEIFQLHYRDFHVTFTAPYEWLGSKTVVNSEVATVNCIVSHLQGSIKALNYSVNMNTLRTVIWCVYPLLGNDSVNTFLRK
jgi:hypothetical protein